MKCIFRRVSPAEKRDWSTMRDRKIFNTWDRAIIAKRSDLKPWILNFVQETDTPGKYIRTSYNGHVIDISLSTARGSFFFSLFLHPFIILPSFTRHYASVTRVEANLCDTWHRATGGNEPPGTRLTSISHFVRCIPVSDTRWVITVFRLPSDAMENFRPRIGRFTAPNLGY